MSLFGRTEEEIDLIIDVGSHGVGGAFVLKRKNSVPLILHSVRKNFRLTEYTSTERVKTEMLEMVDTVCADLQREVQMRPKKIYCVLATPWSHGELRTIKTEREKEFNFTESFAQKLINTETEKFKKEWENLKQVIDKRVTKVLLNGYGVKSPNGKRARSLELHVFLSLAPGDMVRRIEEKIHKTFKTRIGFTSQMFSDFIVVRDIFELQNDFIIVNVGSSVTEVSVMKHDTLVGTAFFPYGEEGIIRDLAKATNKSLFEAKSALSLARTGHLESGAHEKITDLQYQAAQIWLDQFKNILEALSPGRHLPPHVFFASATVSGEFLAEYLARRHFPEFTTSHGDFNVIMSSTRTLHSFCDFTERGDRDESLMRKAIFINQL